LNLIFIIIALIVFGFWYYQKSNKTEHSADLNNAADEDLPYLDYTIYAIDVAHQRKIELHAIKDFPHQFGIVKGQSIEFSWQAINAKKIEIDGLGIVNSVGKHKFFNSENFSIVLTLYNGIHTIEQKIDIHVFPTPILEKIYVPTPKIQLPEVETAYALPNLYIPLTIPKIDTPEISKCVVDISDLKPNLIEPIKIAENKIDFISTKNKVLDNLEIKYKDNTQLNKYIKDIKNKYSNERE